MSDIEKIIPIEMVLAAPDMAAALKPFVEWLDRIEAWAGKNKTNDGFGDLEIASNYFDAPFTFHTLRAARLALSKATGETS